MMLLEAMSAGANRPHREAEQVMLTNDPRPSDLGRGDETSSAARWPKSPLAGKGQKALWLKSQTLKGVGAADFSRREVNKAKNEDGSRQIGQAMTGPSDPRWVLAVRTASLMQGAILPPQARDKLLKTGKVLGLTPFDTNLVIAIVQDQARRGYAPEYCPAAGMEQLRMIPLPGGSSDAIARSRRALYISLILTGVLALEMLVLWLMMF